MQQHKPDCNNFLRTVKALTKQRALHIMTRAPVWHHGHPTGPSITEVLEPQLVRTRELTLPTE